MPDFIGRHFVSPRGEEELTSIRVNAAPSATGGSAPIEMLARVPSDECGCPEELWLIDGLTLLFHFEEDGSSEAFIQAGDWELETAIEARSLDDLRAKAFQWYSDTIDLTDD